MPLFPANINRFDPYKTYRFLVYFGKSTTPVAAVSKVSGLKRSSDVIDYKEGGNAVTLKGLGRTKYEPITLERGVTQDKDFETWANAAQVLDQGSASTSLKANSPSMSARSPRPPSPSSSATGPTSHDAGRPIARSNGSSPPRPPARPRASKTSSFRSTGNFSNRENQTPAY